MDTTFCPEVSQVTPTLPQVCPGPSTAVSAAASVGKSVASADSDRDSRRASSAAAVGTAPRCSGVCPMFSMHSKLFQGWLIPILVGCYILGVNPFLYTLGVMLSRWNVVRLPAVRHCCVLDRASSL